MLGLIYLMAQRNLPPRLPARSPEDYTVGWLCALHCELVSASCMLDNRHEDHECSNPSDRNVYTFGDIKGHNIVIASMTAGHSGLVSAQRLIQPLNQSFPNMTLHLFVGIGGGIPRNPSPGHPSQDIHLGDVVVGGPKDPAAPAVVQYDHIRHHQAERRELIGHLNKPSFALLNALTPMETNCTFGEVNFSAHLRRLTPVERFRYPGENKDILYRAGFKHAGQPLSGCASCDPSEVIRRTQRQQDEFVWHQGTILSGDQLMMDGEYRDILSAENHNAICLEMEAAGVTDDTNCLMIRGIADYADSHKNQEWQWWAAGRAAAFARELLYIVRPLIIRSIRTDASGKR